MRAADTSVIVAAFGGWHEHHAAARKVISSGVALIGQCAAEAYSVLTRLPPPHRAPANVVAAFMASAFPEPPLVLHAAGYGDLAQRLAALGISGGATYDAIVALTAAGSGATLVSGDARAQLVYERCGARFELL